MNSETVGSLARQQVRMVITEDAANTFVPGKSGKVIGLAFKNIAAAYLWLSERLGPYDVTYVEDREYTKRELLLQAIDKDPTNAVALAKLSDLLIPGETAQLPNGKILSK